MREEYYRGMYLMKNTWNIRDKHMATTLDDLLNHFAQLREQGRRERGEGEGGYLLILIR